MKKNQFTVILLLLLCLHVNSQDLSRYKQTYIYRNNTERIRMNAGKLVQSVRIATSEELSDLEKVRTHYPLTYPRAVSANKLSETRNYINSFNIVRNGNNVEGDSFPTSIDYLTTDNQIMILEYLEAIAYSSQRNSSDNLLFQDFIDHIINEEILYKFPPLLTNNYTPIRSITSSLINLISVCNDTQRIEILKILSWVSGYDIVHETSEKIHRERLLTIDHLFLLTESYFYYACYMPDNIAVEELKKLSIFLEISTEYHDGDWDILKRDGTSFHHWTHFNAYMYGYNPWISGISSLKGTMYKIGKEAYNRLKKGMVSMYIMSNRDTSGNFYANSLSGRHPLYGLKNPVTMQSFERMVEIGGDILGTEIDEELASQYNYFFKSDKYNVEPANMDGYYQFNYSPIGVYRKDNWVVTMRAPTTNFWGAEIYSGQNRFGRHQSHGTLEVMYDGDPIYSGIPTSGQGWDWNVVPGATTVHYTNWLDLMPNRNTTARFDQFTKTKDYAGALAWDDFGIFTSDFDQEDTWGSLRFTPTNLEFKKTVFVFDGMLISLGSDIKSSGSYNDNMITATNLFQSANQDSNKSVIVNGQSMTSGSSPITLGSDANHWLITPEGTGYYLPKGNDPLIIKNGMQEGPKYDGSDINNPFKTNAAKAYINHGVKPNNSKYQFVVIPATDQSKMQEVVSKLSSSNEEIYEVNSLSSNLHSIYYKPEKITAYSFFEATDKIKFGKIRTASSEMLIMSKDISDNELSFAVANPNLRPTGSPWVSTVTRTSISVEGNWKLKEEVSGVSTNPPINNQTMVRMNLAYGEPVYFNLVALSDEDNSEAPEGPDNELQINISLIPNSNEVTVNFLYPITEITYIEVYSLSGKLIYNKRLSAGSTGTSFILNGHYDNQVVIISVRNNKVSKVIKTIL